MAAQHALQLPPPPVVQTLARFGKSVKVKGSAADALGNVYFLLMTQGRDAVVMYSGKDHSLTELPLEWEDEIGIQDVAVAPDGEEMYLLDDVHQISVYKKPWGSSVQQLFSLLDPAMYLDSYKQGSLVVHGWLCAEHIDLSTGQQTTLDFNLVETTGESCIYVSHITSDDPGSPGGIAVSVLLFEHVPPQPGPEQRVCLQIRHLYPPRPGGAEAQQTLHLQWPWGLEGYKNFICIPDCCDGDGSLVFHTHDSTTLRFFRMSLTDGHVQLLAGPAPGVDDKDWARDQDQWQGRSLHRIKLPHLSKSILDASGHLVGFDRESGALVRVYLGLKPPVHLQPQPAPPAPPPPPPTWDLGAPFESQLTKDWASMLASGEGADVELRCAGGAVLKAHSLVLSARCEWFRRKQSSGLGQGAVVDLPEHTAATMACVLQFLYTGHVSLAPSAAPDTQGSAAAAASSAEAAPATAAAAGAAAAASDTSDVWQLLRSVSYFQGLSERDPVLLVPLIMVAADQLQLPDLHQACLQLAQIQLSPKTALPWLLAGHIEKQEALEKAALEFVMENAADVKDQSPLALGVVVVMAPNVATTLLEAMACTQPTKRQRHA